MLQSKTQHPTVLQVIPGLHTGGAERTALDIGEALVSRGWNSLVASAGGRMLDDLLAKGNRHFEFPLDSKNPFTIWRNAKHLCDIIESENVSLIHARSRAPAWSALIAARRTGIPFVTTYHGAYNQNSRLKGLYNSVMARADVVIANSQWTANLIKSRNPWASDRVTVIHRGSDFDSFSLDYLEAKRISSLKKQWGLKKGDLVAVHLARLTGWKGQSVVIDAASKLAQDHPNLRFVLAGDAQGRDDYLAGLKHQISAHGLEDTVILPGHCDDPAAAMAIADVVIVASIEAEAFGRAAVEAGALEKPVVVTRIGAVGETVLAVPDVERPQRTGWKVPPGDAEALAIALDEILSLDPDARRKIGKRARLYGEEQFSLQKMCEKTLTVYDSLLEKESSNPH